MNPSSVPPPPPPISGGNLPARRLQTEMSEAPACVQNAMMTKDKKPFTYTPGGIDLSQIKSPRMAKRISMNANSPGVQPKVSPLAQNSSNGNSSPGVIQQGSVPPPPPPPSKDSMGSLAMGMPFQVFPTGPPPPPPPMKNLNSPAPQTNGNKKPTQSFEPPPMGCRPEIKIPPNPMELLRRSPRPQPKNDFWVQEFANERKRDSVPLEEDLRNQLDLGPLLELQHQQQQKNEEQYQQQQSTPTSAPPQKQSSPVRYVQRSPSPVEQQREYNVPVRNVKLEDVRSPSPAQVNRSSPMMRNSSSVSSPITPAKIVTMEPLQAYNQPQSYQQPQTYQQPAQTYQQTPVQSFQQAPQTYQQAPAQSYQQPTQQQPQGGRVILSTMPKFHQQAQQHLGSLYIPPPMSLDDKQYLLSQQSPPWMSSKQGSIDTPEWVDRDEMDNFIRQTRLMSPSSAREHVVPINFERSPNKTPATPGFGPTPFYGAGPQQFNNVVSPKVDPNVNQFVNQGYNNIDFSPMSQQSPKVYAQKVQQSPPQFQQQPQQFQQQAGTRIIPIMVEGGGARSPQVEQTVVMQSSTGKSKLFVHNVPFAAYLQYRKRHLSDPRSTPSPRMNPFGPPNQSRSFKILQQVTNTFGEDSDDNEAEQQRIDSEPMQEQQPLYSRPLGPDEMNETQLRRLQLSENDRAFMNRVKHQVPVARAKPQDENIEQQNREPHLYQGAAIPSRSFKILQAMTQPENAGPGASDL